MMIRDRDRDRDVARCPFAFEDEHLIMTDNYSVLIGHLLRSASRNHRTDPGSFRFTKDWGCMRPMFLEIAGKSRNQ